MRRLVALGLTSALISACASTPPPTASRRVPILPPTPVETGALIGMEQGALIQRLGSPVLQVREGTSLKLQWKAATCVLDAYLYPDAGRLRVTHVEARTPAGNDSDRDSCLAALSAR